MFDEALRRNTLVPLVLRLALAAIFIYHGLDKVSGKNNEWGARMRGEGVFAEQIHALFEVAARRAGLAGDGPTLSGEHFRRPGGVQLALRHVPGEAVVEDLTDRGRSHPATGVVRGDPVTQ